MLPQIYERLLDISSAIDIPVTVFGMYIVYCYSPPNMGSLNLFIFKIMAWNLVANLAGVAVHFHPLFPAECLRAEGIASMFIVSDLVGYSVFGLVGVAAIQCTLASSMTFPYRYIVVAHSEYASKIKRKYGIAVCGAVHLCAFCFGIYFYTYLVVRYDDYPPELRPADPRGVFCFEPNGSLKYMMGILAVICTLFLLLVIIIFSILMKRHLSKVYLQYNAWTTGLETQTKFLRYLIAITIVPVLFGGVPLVLLLLCGAFPEISYSHEIFMCSTVVLYNHGTVFAVVSIVSLKAYRHAAQTIVCNLGKKLH
ncbi:hypothetical protein QR680_015455 [Steinernema hermaphroditum]|uniref:Uncharacterized protein n=1 Tax=Steinernema hermaphroditum TaxID=289476 RepID=A0AA39H8S8_9BILA|nr:hypothetical protein QR680_015455 [Steinernema hermaphroditum]